MPTLVFCILLYCIILYIVCIITVLMYVVCMCICMYIYMYIIPNFHSFINPCIESSIRLVYVNIIFDQGYYSISQLAVCMPNPVHEGLTIGLWSIAKY